MKVPKEAFLMKIPLKKGIFRNIVGGGGSRGFPIPLANITE